MTWHWILAYWTLGIAIRLILLRFAPSEQVGRDAIRTMHPVGAALVIGFGAWFAMPLLLLAPVGWAMKAVVGKATSAPPQSAFVPLPTCDQPIEFGIGTEPMQPTKCCLLRGHPGGHRPGTEIKVESTRAQSFRTPKLCGRCEHPLADHFPEPTICGCACCGHTLSEPAPPPRARGTREVN